MKMAKAYALVAPKLTLTDIIAMRSSTSMRLTTSPFGVTPEKYESDPPIYVGKSVAWKGKKYFSVDAFARAVMSMGEDTKMRALGDGLKKAVSISQQARGVKGTVLWNGKLYPAKCIKQKEIAGKMK